MKTVQTLAASLAALLVLSSSAFAQHDGARDAVRHIANGKFGRVDETLQKKKPFAGDAESAFVKMLSLLEQDKPDEAFANAKDAVKLGMPCERLLAGPREQLGKLHALPEFRQWKFDLNPSKLIHGSMVGNVTDSSASVWVRTDGKAEVLAILSDGSIESVQETTSAESDYTSVLRLDGLQPSTKYPYKVLVDGEVLAEGTFRTFPKQGSAGRFSVGFGGGAGYVPEWESMWNTILKHEPHAMLMLGDNVYIDQPQSAMTQRYCYYRRQSRPEWRNLTANTAMYSIWDDHDFGTNDCIPGPQIDKPAWKREVWEIFRQNWVNPAYGGGESQPGCWYDFHIGDVHFVMLDGRYYRDLKGGTMLGPVQKKWLFETLSKSQATFKVLASPVPFTSGIKPGSRDPWDGYPEEREEIFQFIEDKQIEGVFLIAADRHRTDLRVTERPNGYDLYEFESSRLTNHHTHGVVKTEGLVWGYNKTCSFALMTFDTTAADPQVGFSCIDIDGNLIHSFVLKRSQLGFDR